MAETRHLAYADGLSSATDLSSEQPNHDRTRSTHLSPERGRQVMAGDGILVVRKLPVINLPTENERQDRYDNLDERWAGRRGAFFIQPAGYQMYEIFLSKMLAWRGTLPSPTLLTSRLNFVGRIQTWVRVYCDL